MRRTAALCALQIIMATPTILSVFDSELISPLFDGLEHRGAIVLESTCSVLRQAIAPCWHAALCHTGFADELDLTDAHLTRVARRVVVVETERRRSFPFRLAAAIERLGLRGLGMQSSEVQHSTEIEWEESLRALQYRHHLLLDRRYARALRELGASGRLDRNSLAAGLTFHPDTLPGSGAPSQDSAAHRLAGKQHEPWYPQRAAWLPPTAKCFQKRPTGLTGVTEKGLKELLAQHCLDTASKPKLEELAEGRDIELCAFAPVISSPDWMHVFTPELGAALPQHFFDANLQPINNEHVPNRLINYEPTPARFNWQITGAHIMMRRYTRMASYTHSSDTGTFRTCTPAERQVCTQLEEHGLRPRSVYMPSGFVIHSAESAAGTQTAAVPVPVPAGSSSVNQTWSHLPPLLADLSKINLADEAQ